jgi:methyltransferase
MMLFVLLLVALATQRGIELILASSNTANLRQRGAVEVGAAHYPLMVLLHVGWFAAMLWERGQGGLCSTPGSVMLGWSMLMLGQGLRWWTITTLGRRWSTRIMVLPGAPLVEEGPFRLFRHPNYLGVWLEIVGVPLVGGCWRTALVMGALHGLFLIYRKSLESRVLAEAVGTDAGA